MKTPDHPPTKAWCRRIGIDIEFRGYLDAIGLIYAFQYYKDKEDLYEVYEVLTGDLSSLNRPIVEVMHDYLRDLDWNTEKAELNMRNVYNCF